MGLPSESHSSPLIAGQCVSRLLRGDRFLVPVKHTFIHVARDMDESSDDQPERASRSLSEPWSSTDSQSSRCTIQNFKSPDLAHSQGSTEYADSKESSPRGSHGLVQTTSSEDGKDGAALLRKMGSMTLTSNVNYSEDCEDESNRAVWNRQRPSVGSKMHDQGMCRPCAWNWKPSGCSKGSGCEYCHQCDQYALKARMKQRQLEKMKMMQRRAKRDAKFKTKRLGAGSDDRSTGSGNRGDSFPHNFS